MKFDNIIGNPPYQELKPGNKKSQAIWPKFVERGLIVCSEGGYFSMIHPSGWREPKGMFKKIGEQILNRDVIHVTLYGIKKGIKIFGVGTSCDWYVLKNQNNCGDLTEIKFQDGSIEMVDLSDVEFIPNAKMTEIMSLMAKPNEEKVQILHSYSDYETRKDHVSKEKIEILQDSSYHTQRDHVLKEKTKEFKHPVVYTCPASGKINFWWSNTDKNGHFGVPKVIWSNGTSSIHVDEKGKYGLTQFAYAIVDEPKNLPMIKKALESKKFISLMKSCALNSSHRYNRKVIALFRKDFWKEFV